MELVLLAPELCELQNSFLIDGVIGVARLCELNWSLNLRTVIDMTVRLSGYSRSVGVRGSSSLGPISRKVVSQYRKYINS